MFCLVVGTTLLGPVVQCLAAAESESRPRDTAALLSEAAEAEAAGKLERAAESRRLAIGLLGTAEERIMQGLFLADLYLRMDRPQDEAAALAECLRDLPAYDSRHWPTVQRLLALYRERLSRPSAAVSLLESLVHGLDLGRGDSRVWYELASTRLQMGEPEWARPVFQTLARAMIGTGDPLPEHLVRGRDWCEPYSSGRPSFNRNLETAAILGQYEARVLEQNWSAAVTRVADLLKRFPDATVDAPGVAAVGIRAHVRERVARLPEAARQACARLQLPLVQKLIAGAESEAIEEFLVTRPWPELRVPLLMAAGDALAAERRFSRAAAFYRRAAAIEQVASATRPAGRQQEKAEEELPVNHDALARAARMAILAGEPAPKLPEDLNPTLMGETVTGSEALARWRTDAGRANHNEQTETIPLREMKHDRLRLQQAPLVLKKWEVGWQTGHRGNDNPRMTSAFIPYVLSGDRHQVFLNTSEMVYAIDPLTEKILWTRGPSELFVAELLPPSVKENRLSRTPRRFHTAVSADSVFYRMDWAHRITEQQRSVLFAADRATGALRWSTEGLQALEGMRFMSDPAYADGAVVAGLWEPHEIPSFYLVAIDAVTGDLLWKTQLFSSTAYPAIRQVAVMDLPLGSPPPAIYDGAVYFTASMGVIACLDLLDGELRWLQTYPRVHEYGPQNWAGEFIFNRPSSSPIVRGRRVFAAPQDCRGVLVFDAVTGEHLGGYQSMDFRSMFGADESHVYVQEATDVVALRIHDAAVAWRVKLPTAVICGTPTLSERGIICGTRDGLFVLSPRDGSILEQRPPLSFEAIGNPLDLKDRILTVSTSAVHLLGGQVNGGKDWLMPRSPERPPLQVQGRPSSGIARWTLPAPDRNDFFLSGQAPGLLLVRTWECFQMRRTDPAPSLLWEYAGPAWPRTMHFDERTLVLDYTTGHLIAVDVATGKARWEARDSALQGERNSQCGAMVADPWVIGFTPHCLRVFDVQDGRGRWGVSWPDQVVQGICPGQKGVGVFLQATPAPVAAWFDALTGKEIRRVPLGSTEKTATPQVLSCATEEGLGRLSCLPIVLLDGKEIIEVDFEAGGATSRASFDGVRLSRLHRIGNVLCLIAGPHIVGAYELPDYKPLRPRRAEKWRIADGVQYHLDGPRVVATNLEDGRQIWQSRAFPWVSTRLVVSGKWLLVSQDRTGDGESTSRVVALDRNSGEVVSEAPGLARSFTKVEDGAGSLFAADMGYLYRFAVPSDDGTQQTTVYQDHGDPDALAAVRLADYQSGALVAVPAVSQVSVVVDGDPAEWSGAAWLPLVWPDHWRPDHELLSADRIRRPSGAGDCSVNVALAQDAQRVYLAVQVNDDIHDATAGPRLWRGDSVQVIWVAADPTSAARLDLTFGLVDGVPLVESGLPDAPRRIMADLMRWPDWLRLALDEGDVPWLRRWRSEAVAESKIQFAGRRDDEAGQTVYEVAVAADRLPAPSDRKGMLLWDLRVNDADGAGRVGAMEMGASSMRLARPVGFGAWPAFETGQAAGRK